MSETLLTCPECRKASRLTGGMGCNYGDTATVWFCNLCQAYYPVDAWLIANVPAPGECASESAATLRAATLAEAVQAVDALQPRRGRCSNEARGYRIGINAALEALGRLG